MKDIDTIIFDIGNVLVDFRWKDYIADFGYDEETREKIANASVRSDDWNEYDKGALSEEEVVERFVKNDPSVEAEIRRTYARIDGLLARRDYAIPWIKELKEWGYRVLYLSNFSRKAETAAFDVIEEEKMKKQRKVTKST